MIARPSAPRAEKKPEDAHRGTYNAPSLAFGGGEVSVLVVPPENEKELRRHCLVHLKGGGLQAVDETHFSYDPLHFVLVLLRVLQSLSVQSMYFPHPFSEI